MIVARDVDYSYGEAKVLDGISVTVDDGECVALLGPSGSGKSTLLYCLAGILMPSHGEVELDGVRMGDLSERARTALRARHCGFVLQFGRLVGDLTAVENVSLPLRLLGVRRSEATRSAMSRLDALGIDHLARRKVAGLSGGEQQRVAVARALVHRPRVVFADEPTGALDTANGERVIELLVDACRNGGASLVLVTHDEAVASRADRQVHMRDGAILAATPN